MNFNINQCRKLLQSGDLQTLFIEELGWEHARQSHTLKVDGEEYRMETIAKKSGLTAFQCTAADGDIPPRDIRFKIEREITQLSYEHLIVFTAADQSRQMWLWVRRESGKPIAARTHEWLKGQPGDSLLQKLQFLAVSLPDEEAGVSLKDVTVRVRAAFDVEKVTKKFYKEFDTQRKAFFKFIDGIPEQGDHEWYASVMLNRLMFVYFIQRKGFLNGEPDYLRNRLAQCKQEHGKDKFFSFYRHFLLRLFHEGLGRKRRTAELDQLLGRIPYLNGGIFELHEIEERWDNIQIPDKAFTKILDYFDQYDWVLDSSTRTRRTGDKEEINPDVLGYIFEKYINQKQMGAYYTKEDITEYISKNTILPFLLETSHGACKVAFEGDESVWNLLARNPDRYIHEPVRRGVIDAAGQVILESALPDFVQTGMHDPKARIFDKRYNLREADLNDGDGNKLTLPTETWREYAARRQRCLELREKLATGQVTDINDLITLNLDIRQFAQDLVEQCEGPELLRAFWKALQQVTILDPTCGSGAFLFAALNILEPLYEACLDRMEEFLNHEAAAQPLAKRKASPQGHPVLPRKKFSDFTDTLDRVASHPNRRYYIIKTIILQNLYGVDIMAEAVEICKLRLFLKLAAQVAPDDAHENLGIEPLPDIDFNIRCGNTLVGYATADEVRRCMQEFGDGQMRLGSDDELNNYVSFCERLEDVAHQFQLFRHMQTEQNMDAKDFATAKQKLRASLQTLDHELNRFLADDYGIDVADKKALEKWQTSHQPFHWVVEFYGIVSKGGFDVIIGNPPYVEYAKLSRQYSILNNPLVETGNLFSICSGRFSEINSPSGMLGIIVPISSISTPRMAKFYEFMDAHYMNLYCSNFAVRPSKLFVGVDMNLTIIIGNRSGRVQQTFSTSYTRWAAEVRSSLFPCLSYHEIGNFRPNSSIPKLGRNIEQQIFSKIHKFETLCRMQLATGNCNEIFIHSGGRYFRKCIKRRLSNEYKPYQFPDKLIDSIIASLSSSLFYWIWIVYSDTYHVVKGDVYSFPVSDDALNDKALKMLGVKFLLEIEKNAETRERRRADGTTQNEVNFKVAPSKPIIDEIDQVLAKHYGFTDEELDFIINYDIKYRMGLDR